MNELLKITGVEVLLSYQGVHSQEERHTMPRSCVDRAATFA